MTLAFTGSTEFFSLAALDEKNQLLGEINLFNKRLQQSGIPSIEFLLKNLKMSLDDFKYIGVDDGPGGFTGLRISVAMAKTLAFSHNLFMYTCSSLDLIRRNLPQNQGVIVALDGKQGRVFNRIYYPDGTASVIQDSPPEKLLALLQEKGLEDYAKIGNGFLNTPSLRELVFSEDPRINYPFASKMPECWQGPTDQLEVKARYFRKTQAEEKRDENTGN
jgi:tRNA threonylcarbamoyl adenosine modification protein YeaZ